MSKEIEELMQKSIICENKILSEMIQDIEPKKEQRFTDLEIEATKKEQFSVVVYKKDNIVVRFLKNIAYSLEKMKIMKFSQIFSKIGNSHF